MPTIDAANLCVWDVCLWFVCAYKHEIFAPEHKSLREIWFLSIFHKIELVYFTIYQVDHLNLCHYYTLQYFSFHKLLQCPSREISHDDFFWKIRSLVNFEFDFINKNPQQVIMVSRHFKSLEQRAKEINPDPTFPSFISKVCFTSSKWTHHVELLETNPLIWLATLLFVLVSSRILWWILWIFEATWKTCWMLMSYYRNSSNPTTRGCWVWSASIVCCVEMSKNGYFASWQTRDVFCSSHSWKFLKLHSQKNEKMTRIVWIILNPPSSGCTLLVSYVDWRALN